MRFIIKINEAEDGGSETHHVITTGSDIARTNKRILKEYLTKMEIPENQHKRTLKALGFWGDMGR